MALGAPVGIVGPVNAPAPHKIPSYHLYDCKAVNHDACTCKVFTHEHGCPGVDASKCSCLPVARIPQEIAKPKE